jgi:Transposase IS66 family
VEHRYAVVRCACGHATAARPGTGALSFLEGRHRQLQLSERSLVGPSLAVFIAALGLRHHQSRRRIGEFLITWFGVSLSVGTIDRCLREVGVACEPIVEDLLDEVRAAGVIHADETPWHQGILGRWLWVVLTATTAVFHIGSRRHEEIRDLLGDALLGWLVTDGYGAYRDYERRQRCLAHLIRKGLALAVNPDGFGEWLVRELRNLITAVAEDRSHTILNPIQARLKRACKLHRDHDTEKIRQLAREILNDCRRLRRQPRPAADQQRGPCASPSLPDASASEPGPKRAAPLTLPPSVSSKHAADAEAIPGRTSQIPSLEHAAASPTSPFLPPPKKSGEVNGYTPSFGHHQFSQRKSA